MKKMLRFILLLVVVLGIAAGIGVESSPAGQRAD
jgi:ABC-type glycerol-3-phosphate transport system substrate-binding protein